MDIAATLVKHRNVGAHHNICYVIMVTIFTISMVSLSHTLFSQEKNNIIRSRESNHTSQGDLVKLAGTNPDSVIKVVASIIQRNPGLKPDDLQWLYSMTGYALIKKGQYVQSRTYLTRAGEYAVLMRDSSRKIAILPIMNAIAASYEYEGKYDSAAHYFYQAVDTALTMPVNQRGLQLTSLYYNLLEVWQQLDRAGESSQLYMQEIQALQQKAGKDTGVLALVAYGRGSYFSGRKQFDSARLCYNEAMKLAQAYREGLLPIDQQILNEIAVISILEGKPEEAISLANNAVQLSILRNDQQAIVISNMTLGEAYYKTKLYRQAIRTIEPALDLASKMDLRQGVDSAHLFLSRCYEATGNPGKALYHQKLYSQIRDSILRKDKVDAINRMEVKSQLKRKDMEMAGRQMEFDIMNTKNKINSLLLTLALLVALSIIIILALFYRNNRQKTRALYHKMEINRLHDMLSGEQQERTRVARELHDGILSQLSAVKINLKTFEHINKTMDAPEIYQEALSQFDNAIVELRTTAHNMMPEALNQGLVIAVTVLCKKISSSYPLKVDFQTIGDLPAMEEKFQLSIYRIIQELIQNVVKHARATELLVQITMIHQLLSITVEDNGIGFNQAVKKADGDPEGMGLGNLQQRVKELGGSIEIDSEKNGTSIYAEFKIG